MLSLEEALEKLLGETPVLGTEEVPVREAAGRVLREHLTAPLPLPPFDNSAMDGYALHSKDTRGATEDAPASLRIAGEVPAGKRYPGKVLPGECIRVFTGSPLPADADAVVMQEDTRLSSHPHEVLCMAEIKPWENVRFQGEDVKRGASLLEEGSVIQINHLPLLASMGLERIKVGIRPRVAVLPTGSELQHPGRPLAAGQIYESNSPTLASLIQSIGAVAEPQPPMMDDLEKTAEALNQALETHDVVLTSGGVSVGDYDFVKEAIEKCGGKLSFWKVAIKPGKPFLFGKKGDKLVLGVPGNPVSSFVTALLLVCPVLMKMQGATHWKPASLRAVLGEPLRNPGDRRHFLRVAFNPEGKIISGGPQGSHRLESLARADGLIDLPPETEWPEGKEVSVLLWQLPRI